MQYRTVDIVEVADGWKCGETVFGTAVQALNAMRDSGKVSASEHGGDMLQLNWIATTRIGRAVIKAIATN